MQYKGKEKHEEVKQETMTQDFDRPVGESLEGSTMAMFQALYSLFEE
jgi:hypothetical protein